MGNGLIAILIPIGIIQLLFQGYCLVDLIRREKVKYGNKMVWGAVIVLGSFIGSTVYLVMRGDEY